MGNPFCYNKKCPMHKVIVADDCYHVYVMSRELTTVELIDPRSVIKASDIEHHRCLRFNFQSALGKMKLCEVCAEANVMIRATDEQDIVKWAINMKLIEFEVGRILKSIHVDMEQRDQMLRDVMASLVADLKEGLDQQELLKAASMAKKQ